MSQVVCAGIVVADVWGRPIDTQPEHGRLMLVDDMGMSIGGCAANTGIGLAKLGVDTSIIGKVGQDGFGAFVREAMAAEGVDTSGIAVSDEANTSATMIMIDSGGERTFIHCIGANATMKPSDIDMDLVGGADIFHVPGRVDERLANRIHTIFQGKLHTLSVPWCKCADAEINAWNIQTFSGAELTTHNNSAMDIIFLNLLNLQFNKTVVKKQDISFFNHTRQCFHGHGYAF